MAVIIRENIIIGGKECKNVIVYKSDGFVISKKDRENAEKIDKFIEEKLRSIEKDLKNGKKGTLKFWYKLGKKLQFIDKLEVSNEDIKWIWRALYDHAGDLSPSLSERAEKTLNRNFFFKCYYLGKLDWAIIENINTVSFWSHFLEIPFITGDRRIFNWFIKKFEAAKNVNNKKEWIRNLTRLVIDEFGEKCDTTIFSDKEINTKLNYAFNNFQQHNI